MCNAARRLSSARTSRFIASQPWSEAEKKARLAEALRTNLRSRKAQAREKDADTPQRATIRRR